MNTTCIVADLGGTFLRCGVVGPRGALGCVERSRLPGDAGSRGEEVWGDVISAIASYADKRADKTSPISFAFPGPVRDGRFAMKAPTVLSSDAPLPDIRGLLAARTRREVLLVNDVSAAAWYFSERVPASRFAVVTISSGIGAKIYDRRHPLGVLDDTLYAGELGHIIVDSGPQAKLCDCGGRGHLGAIASARGVERSARDAARRDIAEFATSACAQRWGATAATLTNEAHLVPAMRSGDAWSIALLRQSIVPLGRTLHALTVGCGLGGIVVMGGFAQQLGEVYRGELRDALAALGDCGPAELDVDALLTIAGVDEEPSLVGAASYARLCRYAA